MIPSERNQGQCPHWGVRSWSPFSGVPSLMTDVLFVLGKPDLRLDSTPLIKQMHGTQALSASWEDLSPLSPTGSLSQLPMSPHYFKTSCIYHSWTEKKWSWKKRGRENGKLMIQEITEHEIILFWNHSSGTQRRKLPKLLVKTLWWIPLYESPRHFFILLLWAVHIPPEEAFSSHF